MSATTGASQPSTAREALIHPTETSKRVFDYPLPPGDHLREFYNALYKAVDAEYPNAPKRIARLMPRGHGKSEGLGVVFPTWLILNYPAIRVAIISKTADLAAERTSKVVEYIERCEPIPKAFEIADAAGTQLTTTANNHKEATISPYGLESQLTGKHFDVVIYDDIADWDNQRTQTQRRNVRTYFRDYTKNLGDPNSVLEGGAVQAMIGTRKHPQDIYETDVLNSATWDTKVWPAISEQDWPLVEQRAWTVRGADGQVYDDIGDLPEGIPLANNGVIPDQEVNVLWPEHKPPEALLYDIVDGDDSTPIWRRENQQDPQALSGEVFESEWLIYTDDLPNPESSYDWYAGLDVGLVDDLQQAAEDDTDYSALAVIAWDGTAQTGYLHHLTRNRGMSVKATADWAERQLSDYTERLTKLLVEQNANRGVAQRLRDDTPINAEGTSSAGAKVERIHNMAAEFESGDVRIVGKSTDERWRSFETDEWLQFPNAAHDDRLDAVEIALRAKDRGGRASRAGSMTDLLG